MNFTKEQVEIFEFVKNGTGHGIIDAVAGAGKTTTIMECAKYVPDRSNILFCAFNKSIATEIESEFGRKNMSDVVTKTIHALGLQILHNNNSTGKIIVLNNNKYNQLLKNIDIQRFLLPHVKKIVKYNGFEYDETQSRQEYPVENIIRKFNYKILEINAKFRLTLCKDSYQDFKKMILHYGIFNSIDVEKRDFDKELESYLECHQILLKHANLFSEKTMVIDYADMLYLPYAWKQYPSKKYGFVFIDECQDLSRSQLAVALKYARAGSRILSVGDPRQSIYGFTGADIESFGTIENTTKAKRLPLTLCFRCPQGIIEIAKSIRNDIVGSKTYNGTIKEIRIDEVVDLAQPNDLIISRTKAPLLLLVFEFIEKDIKVKIHPDIAKDMIEKLRRLFKKEELIRPIYEEYGGFERLKSEVIARREWIINKEAERIIDADERRVYIKEEKSLIESELEFLHKRYEVWRETGICLEDIFKKLYSYVNEKVNPITISTIHTAKGLEQNRVTIINYFDLPLSHPEHKDWEKIQEINLKYVAVTRAKEELYLVKSEKTSDIESEKSLFDDLFEI